MIFYRRPLCIQNDWCGIRHEETTATVLYAQYNVMS